MSKAKAADGVAKEAKPRVGRPAGAETIDRDTAEVTLSRCTKCGSTERTPYTRKRDVPLSTDPEFTHVVLRYTTCKSCGQVRIDRAKEYRKCVE